jgi:hypothetical protein
LDAYTATEESDRHSLIVGLFAILPEDGAEFTTEQRERWFHLAEAIFAVIYDDPTSEGTYRG